jgi:capsule polysaccharide export protein KpsE/RkpR
LGRHIRLRDSHCSSRERLEDELTRPRKDLDDREAENNDRDTNIDKLHTENRDLASQLAVQRQARLNVSDKLDGVQGNLRLPNLSWLRSTRR